jgi:hypothetical protein
MACEEEEEEEKVKQHYIENKVYSQYIYINPYILTLQYRNISRSIVII